MSRTAVATLWRFARQDMFSDDFEAWLYAQEDLEEDLGEELYIELISFDYRNQSELFVIREKLAMALRPSLKCECVTLPDLAVVPMGFDGLDDRVFATLERVCDHGPPQWWLHLFRCATCGQNWVVAQEERIFDDYFFRRLQQSTADKIVAECSWPSDFITYERVLKVGQALSKPFRFTDPLSLSLVWTAQDLRRERPDITTEEIADLMGISSSQVDRLLSVG
ncbi:hypothetical protein C5708_07155 [Caulobacter sp. CCUG 60055]|uniref:hypothetical protein n=1 Tax=Caulobacter sp. CCUG 60055 TaxID=2100090 RepID=UPI001FA7ABAB|nr:hypothetical protein [Caulobacter sp. CCUG 60055]MBQ1543070.1 hypothetical protein [Caulobacteraceae bacterium]MCI3180030.1 hypothetical protein [Caulobacter sp. CCUG 60055]